MTDLEDGESIEVKGSRNNTYRIENTGGVYSCTCPAWRHQSLPIEKRTCKHIRKLRGDDAEAKRLGSAGLLSGKPRRKGAAGEAEKKDEPPLLLAHKWEMDVDLAGWWMSEKLDGVRAYWDGSQFLSRLGNKFHAPQWFTQRLPKTPLDGELWGGRKMFQRTVGIVKRHDESDHWKEIQYVVFDAPAHGDVFERRIEHLHDSLTDVAQHLSVLAHEVCEGEDHLNRELARVEKLGGEGLMLRQPKSKYVEGRSSTLLKVKSFFDAEARILEHVAGTGKHKGRLGSLLVELPDGSRFNIGTGFSDAQREAPPEPGTIVTFRYQELTNAGIPRFPVFIGERVDFAWPASADDAPAPRRAGSGASEKARSSSRARATKARSRPKRAASATTTPKAESKAETKAKAKAAAPKPNPMPSGAAELSGGRYFEFVDDKSSKFWEIAVEGSAYTIRYGRIGTKGQSKTKAFPSADKAQAAADKITADKVRKGYVEKTRADV